jgi:hypothetical protein
MSLFGHRLARVRAQRARNYTDFFYYMNIFVETPDPFIFLA